MNIRRKTIFGTMLCLALPFTSIAEDIKASGGAAPMENVFTPIKAEFEKSSGLTLELKNVGPEDSFKELAEGKVDLCAAGVTINAWFEMMEKANYAIADKSIFKSRVVGKDKIQVYTHTGVAVTNLTKEQLADIFSGKIENWKDVGGPDMPIVVILGSKASGTNNTFNKAIPAGTPYTAKVVDGGNSVDSRKLAAKTPGAIGIGPLAANDGTLNYPTTPEVARPITVLTKGAPSEKVMKLFKFIDGDGQKLIKK